MEDHNSQLRDVSSCLLALNDLGTRDLRDEYERLFGEPTRSRNAAWLRRKLAWRIQELAHGGLSDRAQARIDEVLAWMDAEARSPIGAHRTVRLPKRRPAPKTTTVKGSVRKSARDPRLPAPGAILHRTYKGTTHEVTVLDDGFTWNGDEYDSLSKVATAISGSRRNGFRFFGLKVASAAKAAS